MVKYIPLLFNSCLVLSIFESILLNVAIANSVPFTSMEEYVAIPITSITVIGLN
jgi:hypothetical protein